MTTSHLKRPLRLTLHPQDVLPEHMSWRLHEGYVRSATWDDDGESITLGVWGPGDVISSEDPVLHPLELHCLTTVVEHLELAVHVLLTARMDSCMSIFSASLCSISCSPLSSNVNSGL